MLPNYTGDSEVDNLLYRLADFCGLQNRTANTD